MSETVAYVSMDWPDNSSPVEISGNTAVGTTTIGRTGDSYSYPQWTYPIYDPPRNYWWVTPMYHWYSYQPKEMIRLKLSEVETLRNAAKDDKKLKKVLRKFAPHIEIEVDFP